MDFSRHTPFEEAGLHAVSIMLLALAIARWIPIALAVSLVALVSGSAALSAARRTRELARRRRAADAVIGSMPDRWLPQDVSWRVDELTAPGNRRQLARQLHVLAGMAHQSVLLTSVPVSPSTLRPNGEALAAMAGLVADVERPLAPRGIVMLEDLLDGSGGSPLYRPAQADELGRALARVDGAMVAAGRAPTAPAQDGSTSRYPAPGSVKM